MKLQEQNFTLWSGEAKELIVSVTSADGSVIDLNDFEIFFVAKGNREVLKDKSSGISIPVANVIKVSLTSEDTRPLLNDYKYQIILKDSLGRVSVVCGGTFSVTASLFNIIPKK